MKAIFRFGGQVDSELVARSGQEVTVIKPLPPNMSRIKFADGLIRAAWNFELDFNDEEDCDV